MPLSRRPITTPETSGAVARTNNRNVSVHSPQAELIPGFGNVTAEDMIIPRLKLLQGMSPEVKDDPRTFIQGEYLHTILGECIGEELLVAPLQCQRSIELWAPRDSGEGILARSTDGIHWDKPNSKFEVRLNGGRRVVWDTKNSVAESGLADFGSSDPSNPKSAPIAPLTYRLALYLLDRPELSPVLFICSRTATIPVKSLISAINMRRQGGQPFYLQRYRLTAPLTKRGPYEYFIPSFGNVSGIVEDAERRSELKNLAQAMATLNVRTADDRLDDSEQGPPPNEPYRPNARAHTESAY